MAKAFHLNTPFLLSGPLSRALSQARTEDRKDSDESGNGDGISPPSSGQSESDAEVYVKMDCMQPSGSFKIRGIGKLCADAAADGATHFVASSGGNAGMAAAYSGRMLGIKTTIVIPSSTPEFMIDRLRAEGATVRVHGENWNAADELAREIVAEAKDPEKAVYVHPFDDPLLWEGHTSMIEEIKEAWPHDSPPDAVICVVGGGGLLVGVSQGLDKVGWRDVPIIAAETQGAHAFNAAVQAKHHVTIPEITSIAKSLGAKKVAASAYSLLSQKKVSSVVVSDTQAVHAALKFADHHRCLVEPACSAGLAVVYEQLEVVRPCRRIIVIVCGGNQVTLSSLEGWKKQFGIEYTGN